MNKQLLELYQQTRSSNSKPFFVTNKKLTYGESLKRIEKITALFQQRKVIAGDRILLLSSNDQEIALLFLSCIFNGVTFTILDCDIKQQRATAILNSYAPKLIFIDRDQSERLNLTSETAEIIYLEKSYSFIQNLIPTKNSYSNYYTNLANLEPCKPSFDSLSWDNTAYILFTSGTTSQPKGVEISYKNLFTHIATLQKVYALSKKSVILNLMPLTHADGLIQGPFLAFVANATIHRPCAFRIQELEFIAETFRLRKITHFIAAPTMLVLMHRYLKNKKKIFEYQQFYSVISVAAQLEAQLYINFTEAFRVRIINVYGLTETVSGGIFTDAFDSTQAGTIGKPIDCEAKIVDSLGEEVPEGELGELLLKGKSIMKGYFKDPEATALVLNDGWLSTGDLAQCISGVYSIIGRKKSAIIFGGYNVYPEEITEILNSHESVAESATFGRTNSDWGEEAVAAVVLKSGSSCTSAELRAYCLLHLETYKVPRCIVFLDELPRGKSGKVKLELLKANVQSLSNHDQSLLDQVRQVAAECFMLPADEISAESDSNNINSWDSLGHLDFIASLEKAFSLRFKTSEVLGIDSIGDAVAIIESRI